MTDTIDEPPEVARLAADAALFTMNPGDGELMVLLVQRGCRPRAGYWGLPGGHLDIGEDDRDAAARELWEETRLHAPDLLVEVGSYRSPFRDSRTRVVSWAWAGVLDMPIPPVAGDDARAAAWWTVDAVMADTDVLAFPDHAVMIDHAMALLLTKGMLR